ncbi:MULTISPECIES: sensor histidine kinase [unclassified Pseudoclavibacter]|uniref:ATP-binding protein n=1 Tax=unclassified Pseudoclavibacter TaxID=2615177 RepID=UPI0015E3AA61|nr:MULTISPECIES: sensor histidine kinase [unclassified Pseudoclavibacter]
MRFASWSVATRLFVLQFVAILVLTGIGVAIVWADARREAEDDAALRSLAVAETIAHDPFVVEQLETAAPSSSLQPYAISISDSTGVDFITIMNTDGVRITHRNPEEIGRPFQGNIDAALAGSTFTETYTGTLGPSVRAVAPIWDDGEVVALVSAGVTVSNAHVATGSRIALILWSALGALLIGGAGAWALSRYLRRVTDNRGPEDLARMFAYYEGVLRSIDEGLVLIDTKGRIALTNVKAAEYLGLPPFDEHAAPVPVRDLEAPEILREVMLRGEAVVDEIVVTERHVLVVNGEAVVTRGPGHDAPRFAGTVVTLRDHSRIEELSGELETSQTLAAALRSQAHEFANRLHTIIALIELGQPEEAMRLASSTLGVSQELADRLVRAIEDPVLVALLLGKSAQADEMDVRFELHLPERVPASASARDLITIVGNLVDNALEAARTTPSPAVRVLVEELDGEVLIEVSDSGEGPDPDFLSHIFDFGVSGKPGKGRGVGLALVRQAVRRSGGSIDVEGSAFTVCLPLREQPEARAEDTVTETGHGVPRIHVPAGPRGATSRSAGASDDR